MQVTFHCVSIVDFVLMVRCFFQFDLWLSVNPEIVWRSRETFTLWDDCMSFPDLMVKVRRHRSISIQFQDVQGQIHQWSRINQAFSELLQHEMDHLDGILAVDIAIEQPISRKYYLDNQNELNSQVDYVIQPTVEQ